MTLLLKMNSTYKFLSWVFLSYPKYSPTISYKQIEALKLVLKMWDYPMLLYHRCYISHLLSNFCFNFLLWPAVALPKPMFHSNASLGWYVLCWKLNSNNTSPIFSLSKVVKILPLQKKFFVLLWPMSSCVIRSLFPVLVCWVPNEIRRCAGLKHIAEFPSLCSFTSK